MSVADDRSTYNISFVGALGYTNITTALTLDATNVVYAKYYQSVVTMNTAEVEQLFSETTEDYIEPILEIEIVDGGTRQTALQSTVKLRRDLITSSSAIPTPQANYLTAAESYAAFLLNSTTGFNSSGGSQKLYGSDGAVKLQATSIGLGFFTATPVAQQSQVNVVTGLINLGLLASSATYGVLPTSPYTVTTLTSVTFGTVNANDQHYRDVTVTGAAVNDAVILGLPAAVSAGAVIQGVVYKANTVCLSCTNADNTSIAVNTATYRITVIGY